MSDLYKIIDDITYLRQPCESVEYDEGMTLGKLLLEVLSTSKSGVGLAANQIGIRKRVCVINVNKPIILINPRIIGGFEKIVFDEGCLSFTGEVVRTQRYKNILVKSDTNKSIMSFYGIDNSSLLESVCVQHEIDHLNGITMHDRQKEKIL